MITATKLNSIKTALVNFFKASKWTPTWTTEDRCTEAQEYGCYISGKYFGERYMWDSRDRNWQSEPRTDEAIGLLADELTERVLEDCNYDFDNNEEWEALDEWNALRAKEESWLSGITDDEARYYWDIAMDALAEALRDDFTKMLQDLNDEIESNANDSNIDEEDASC